MNIYVDQIIKEYLLFWEFFGQPETKLSERVIVQIKNKLSILNTHTILLFGMKY